MLLGRKFIILLVIWEIWGDKTKIRTGYRKDNDEHANYNVCDALPASIAKSKAQCFA